MLLQNLYRSIRRSRITTAGRSGPAIYSGLPVDTPPPLPLMAEAMADQLGLRLEPRKGPRQVLVIDRATAPLPD